ncbi:MAG: DUF169 domain-containing protein [bacterium]
MELAIRDRFIELWQKYFNNAELPLAFYYSKKIDHVEVSSDESTQKSVDHRCLICNLNKVRNGASQAFGKQHINCGGGRWFAGFTEEIRSDFNYYLSCGSEKTEGERYKRDPEIVKLMLESFPHFSKGDHWLVFKRWDKLSEEDEPEVVVFFAEPHVLSGLFMLANYDFVGNAGVISPFGSGCSTITLYPYMEKDKENPRSVLGMFDPSARACVGDNELTFSTPYNRLITLMDYMEESFLITNIWEHLKKRIK